MTKKLSFCLKAIKTLDDQDLDALTAGIEAYVKGGMPTVQAENAAVADLLALVDGERTEIVGLLREQHPDLFSITRPRPLGSTAKFAENKIFTADKVQAARARLRSKLGTTQAAFDPEMMVDVVTIAGGHIEAGVRKFKDFVAAMVEDLGEGVKPYLLTAYEGVRHYPGFDASGMTKPEHALQEHNEMLAGPAKEQDDGQDDTGAPGAEALGEVATPQSGDAEGVGDSERSDSGGGVTSPASNDRADRPRVSRARSGGSGSTSVRAPAPRTRSKARPVGAEGARPEGSAVQGVEPVSVGNVPAVNFRITDDVRLGKGGEVEKFNDNLAAIQVLKRLEGENRRAIYDEQRKLARYVGWGGLANAFPNPTTKEFKPEWKARGEALRDLLTPQEYDLARRSTLDSHYTSTDVVTAMWDAARRLGFIGGTALESSMGIGNFVGLMPDGLLGQTRFVGIEYDSLTARMAAALYPQDTVLHSGFQDVPLPDRAFDLAIGNPPFGEQSLHFQFKPELRGASIHNQFIRASLDAVKPGGLSVQVVSRYLMDKVEASDRNALAKKAKLLGAIRLPDTAFKENARTSVVTDILFFQRLTEAEEQEMASAFEAQARGTEKVASVEATRLEQARKVPEWTKVTKVKDPLGGEDITVNSYFAANKHMILGTLERSGTMAHGKDITVRAEKEASLSADLARAVSTLPENVTDTSHDVVAASLERFQAMSDSLKIGVSGQERGSIVLTPDGKLEQVIERETPEGDYELAKRELTETSPWSDTLLQDSKGRWYTLEVQVDPETGKPVKMLKNGKATKRNVVERRVFEKETDISPGLLLGATRLQRLKEMAGLRDLFVKQINLETQDAPSKAMEANRKELAATYKAFTDKHGWVNDPANAALVANMPDGALVLALEDKYRPAITPARAKAMGEAPRGAIATPMPILTRRVIPKYEPPTRASSGADALAISLSETGRIDLARMADLLQTDEQGVIDQLFTNAAQPLMFKDPETERWETRNDYLSGQVRRKYNAAKGAGLVKNAEALEAVQPEPWTAENVTALLGSTWVPPKFYEDFAVHITGNRPRISYSKLTNTYTLGRVERTTGAKREEWGTEAMDPLEIIDAMLNTKPVRVYDRTDDGPRINLEQTALAQLKAKQIATEFSDWVFADGERRTELVDTFNELYNTRVVRQYDGSHLVLPGKVPDAIIKMRRHQKNAIWRGIYERFMLTDHVVGAGKTYTAIARSMERRRMGLSKKPAIIVPNHLVEEWTNAVYKLYPGAKVLAAGKNDFERSRRRKIFAKIASGDWDIVIIPHSSFGFIGIAPETEQRYLELELTAAEAAIKEAEKAAQEAGNASSFRKPFGVKEAERLRDKIQARMDKIKGADKRDRLLTFEQLGIDDLTVDEAHEFKNLFYSSRLTDVKGMGNKTGSQKAFDLYNKVRILTESPTGSVHFMTGTPISNSAVEMYNMMRYLAAAQLDELGLNHFDAWRAQFVSTDPGWEANETGRLKEVNRLGRTWSNMRSLMDLYYSFTDSVSNDDIKTAYAADTGKEFPIPKVKGGDRQSVVIDPTPAQVSELERVIAGFDALPNITDPYERNISRLKLMDRARKVSLDVRAANPGSASRETGGKLEVIAENVHRIYKAWDADKGTQLVFLDRSVPKAKGDDKILKDYDGFLAEREAALRAGDEEAYRIANDKLDGYDTQEMEALRNAQFGGWNAYQQIKDNLVAMGVPEKEIRFIQEANNDAQKQALFDAVNAGEVRVLIGSTPRMGAGTNVQQRLVGLHHADVTWKPSDIEQREGRIIRQGNLFATPPDQMPSGVNPLYKPDFEAEILAYATERTIDAKMWGLNSAKLRTINGIRKYNGDFTMEFEDAESVSMAELAALASGDPLLLERVQLDSDITKLELLERQHRRKAWGIEGAIDTAKRDIETLPAQIEQAQAAVTRLRAARDALAETVAGRSVTVEGKTFTKMTDAIEHARAAVALQQGGNKNARYSLTINGQKYTAQEAYQDAIHDALGDFAPFDVVIDGSHYTTRKNAARDIADKVSKVAVKLPNGGSETVDLGTFAGHKFEADVSVDNGGGSFWVEFTVIADDGTTLATASSSRREDFTFTTQSLTGPLGELKFEPERAESSLGYYQRRLATSTSDLPGLEARRGGKFAQAGELADKRARLEEVTRLLSATGPTTAPSTPDAPEAEPGIAADMPDASADFEDDAQRIPVAEVVGEGPAHPLDVEAVARVADIFAKHAPNAFKNLKLTALPRTALPAEGASPLAVQRHAGAELMEKVYGKRVVWFSANMPFANGLAPHEFPNVIFVNEATRRPIPALLGHELTHQLRVQNPALYDKLVARLTTLLNEPGRYHDLIASRYRAAKIPVLADDKAREELIADIVGDFHTDPRFWRDLAHAQSRGFRRVLELVKQFFDNLISKLRSERPYGTDAYLTDIEAARAAVVEVMNEYANGKGPTAAAADNAVSMSANDDPFYSELGRHIASTVMKKGTADSWNQLLKSLHTKGVKADEIAWTGIEEWLALQPGTITREQVLDYLNSNGLKVTETVLGAESADKERDRMSATYTVWLDAQGLPQSSADDLLAEDSEAATLNDEARAYRGVRLLTDEQRAYIQDFSDRWEALESDDGSEVDSLRAKYGQYTLPGGSNYREVLIQTPENKGGEEGPRGWGDTAGGTHSTRNFISSHWDGRKNIVAHIRVNDRTDADGKKVLFVEEIQSDWAQRGKKQGFIDPLTEANLITKAEYDQATANARHAIARNDDLGFDSTNRALASVTHDDNWRDNFDLEHDQDAIRALEIYIETRNAFAAQGGAPKTVPAGPFVTKTDAWVGLAIKRVIKMAVDGGYDRVAFVNGKQSADRYSLSKQIESVVVENTRAEHNEVRLRAYDHQANQVIDKRDIKQTDLDDYIGKELADRARQHLVDYGRAHLKGLDLEVGGEGMKAFYEKIVPKVAKELVRKFGGEGLRQVNMSHDPNPALDQWEPEGGPGDGSKAAIDQFTQLGFDITPAMVEKAAGGLPMMSLGGNYTPEQKTALAKAGIDTRTRLQRIGDRLRAYYPRAMAAWQSNWARQFQQGALDQFTGINLVEQTLLGKMAPDQSAYVAARLANGGTSSVMRGLMLHGQARWAKNGQHLEKIPGTEGLLDIFRPLGADLNDFFGWMIGNRAARLLGEGKENNLSKDEIAALRGLNKGKEAEFRRAALKYAAFKRSVLDLGEASGLIDPEKRAVWDQSDYIPFYREMDETKTNATGQLRGMSVKGLTHQSSGIRMLKGGTGALNDPMENIIMNFSRLVDASLKNNALRKTVDMVVNAGSDIVEKVGYDMSSQLLPADQIRKRLEAMGTPDVVLDNIPPGALEGMAKMWAIQAPTDPDVVRVMVNGKPQFYKVNDPLLLKALTSFVPFDFPTLGAMRAFKRLLTGMVTATPEFMARNYIRDSAASQMIGRTGFNPAKSLTGVAKSFMESGGFEDMLFAGASFQSGNIDAGDPVATGRAMRRALRKRGFDASSAGAFMGSIVDTPAKFWDGYRKFGESIENANREAIYEATLKKTQSITSAAYEAKDLMDFSLRGSSPIYQLFADVLPFFNARVQGLYRAGRADPKRLIAYGLLMMALSLALAIENWDNPDYEALPDWDKDTYWHFWINGEHFRLPKPFELGVVFATIPERILRYAKDHDTGKKLAGRVWANIRDQLAFDPIPQALRPAANVWANKDTFRDRPIETMSDEGKLPSQRFGAMTSPTAREAVKLANVGGAMDTIGLSPRKLEYLVGGYLGTTGLYALGLSDMAVNAMKGAAPKPQMRLDDYPLVRVFYRMEPARATVYESDLYEMRNKAAEIYKSVMAQAKDGKVEEAQELAEKHKELLAVRPTIERQAKTLSQLNKLRDQVFASRDLTPKQKRAELDKIQLQKNELTRATMTQPVVRATQ